MSNFANAPSYPPDPILGLNALFAKDPNPKKVSLGVGAYRDGNGKPWVLPSVIAAEKYMYEHMTDYNKEYPPISGTPAFRKAAAELLFGEDHPALKENRVATCQSLSGTGGLHIGFDYLHSTLPQCQVYIPATTWPNHFPVYDKCYPDTPCKKYQYLAADGSLKTDIDATVHDLTEAADHSIILLHSCAHNPSGIDWTHDEWSRIIEVLKNKKHIAFFDNAYQGFASGSFEEDGYAIRRCAREGLDVVVAQSFSKNFGLYGERVGAIHIVHSTQGTQEEINKITENLVSGLMSRIRMTYSMNPIHGAHIVTIIVNNPELKAQFYEDIKVMSGRIHKMRALIRKEMEKLLPERDWSFFTTAVGMFTFTGLSKDLCLHLRNKYSVYLVPNGGRMSMCGLTESNVKYVAESIANAIKDMEKKD